MYPLERYQKPASLAEAVRLLAADPLAMPVAGGTDTLVRLREGHLEYNNLVDLRGLSELQPIEETAEGDLRIGSGATFTRLMDNDLVKKHAPVLAEAAGFVAGPQIRNVATVGGNLCIGSVCADSASPLLVLDARLELHGPEGIRVTPLRGFHIGPGKVERRPGEVLAAIIIRRQDCDQFGAAYTKYSMRQAMDIATIGCGAACKLDKADGNTIQGLRLAFTVAAPTPIRCPEAEAVALGKPFTEETLHAVCTALAQDVKPRTSWRASKEFRLHIIRTLARRMILAAAERARGANQC